MLDEEDRGAFRGEPEHRVGSFRYSCTTTSPPSRSKVSARTADGRRFLMVEQAEEPLPPAHIVLIPNLPRDLQERVSPSDAR